MAFFFFAIVLLIFGLPIIAIVKASSVRRDLDWEIGRLRQQIATLESRIAKLQSPPPVHDNAQKVFLPVTPVTTEPLPDDTYSSVASEIIDPTITPINEVPELKSLIPLTPPEKLVAMPPVEKRVTPPAKLERVTTPPRAAEPQKEEGTPPLLQPLFEVWPLLVRFVRRGNSWVTAGAGVLLVGLGFFAQYVGRRGFWARLFPVEIRLALVALCGLGLTYMGWKLRERKPTYGLVTQGAGVAIFYLTIFATVKLTSLLSTPIAFALLIAIVALSTALALLQDSQAFACFATVGGFAAPLLVSTGSGNFIGLFSFYVLLNAGILRILYTRLWKGLPLAGFICTFSIFGAWVLHSYDADVFRHVLFAEIFLLSFFFAYTFVTLFLHRATIEKGVLFSHTDLFISSATPLAFLFLQGMIIRHLTYGLATSALLSGAFYIAMAHVLWQQFGESSRKPTEIALASGVVLSNLAIPLALSGYSTALFWIVEGMLLHLVATRYNRKEPLFFGLLLQIIGGLLLFVDTTQSVVAVANARFVGGIVASVCALVSVFTSYNKRTAIEGLRGEPLQKLLLVWACVWWYRTLFREVWAFAPADYAAALFLSVGCLSALFFYVLSIRFECEDLKWNIFTPLATVASVVVLYAPASLYSLMAKLSIGQVITSLLVGAIPLYGVGMLVWPLFFASIAILFFRERKRVNENAAFAACALASVWWLSLWAQQVFLYTPITHHWNLFLLIFTLNIPLFIFMAQRMENTRLRFMAFIPLGFIALSGFFRLFDILNDGMIPFLMQAHPLRGWGVVAWPLFFVSHYALITRQKGVWGAPFPTQILAWSHRAGFFLFVVLLQLEVHYWVHRLPLEGVMSPWWGSLVILMLLPLIIYALFRYWEKLPPVMQEWRRLYLVEGCGMLCGALLVWFALTLFRIGDASPLPYIPLLNPLDLALALCLATALFWWQTVRNSHYGFKIPVRIEQVYWALGLSIFLWNNAALFRVLAHYIPETYGFPYAHGADIFLGQPTDTFFADGLLPIHFLLEFGVTQTAITLLWGTWGSALMFYGARKLKQRRVWFAGSVLLASVTLKIFLVDLSQTNTLTRIVSFIVTGVVLIGIGYFAPMPPAKELKD